MKFNLSLKPVKQNKKRNDLDNICKKRLLFKIHDTVANISQFVTGVQFEF